MVDYFGINLQGRDGDEGHMDLEYKQRYVARCAKQRRKMLSTWLNRPVCLVLSANKDITVLSLYGEEFLEVPHYADQWRYRQVMAARDYDGDFRLWLPGHASQSHWSRRSCKGNGAT